MTKNLNNKKSLSDEIFKKIEKGQVKMRPKFYFVLKALLAVCSVVLMIVFILFLISFISFYLRASGIWYLPSFGLRGFAIYLKLFPWLLIILSIILILILETLTRRFSFVWRRPIFYSLLTIILIAVVGGFVIEKTSFHPDLLWRVQEGRLPLMGPIYRQFNRSELRDVQRGIIEEVVEEGFKMRTFDGQLLTVILTQETRFPFEKEIESGDSVVVMGERKNDTVWAFGVRGIEDEFRKFERRHFRSPMRQNNKVK